MLLNRVVPNKLWNRKTQCEPGIVVGSVNKSGAIQVHRRGVVSSHAAFFLGHLTLCTPAKNGGKKALLISISKQAARQFITVTFAAIKLQPYSIMYLPCMNR